VCTATWLRQRDRLHLFFNRDEERRREPALPPRELLAGGVRCLAPLDGRAGGTWILASERGLALALLNRSEGKRPAGPTRSRGELPLALAGAIDPVDLETALARMALTPFPPFTLLALWSDPAAGTVVAWDGESLDRRAIDPNAGVLCSSGLGDEPARRQRETTWRQWRERAGAAWSPRHHRELHRSHEPRPHAFSVCMHREDAATLSMVEIEIDGSSARLAYRPGPPCQEAPSVEASLDLARSHSRG
jgi:Transport and Golgi organisation 2